MSFWNRWHVRRAASLALLVPFLTVAVLIASVGMAGTASAHAAYVSSTPAANAVLTAAPTSVSITFAENMTPADSNIVVYDSAMKQVSTGDATVNSSDLKTMSVPMKGDDSDVFVVVWHNVSADDGDPDAGSFSFYIGSDKAPTTSTSTTDNATSSGGTPGWVVALVGILGLVIGAGGATLVTRRSPAAR
jgi:copper transport protein